MAGNQAPRDPNNLPVTQAASSQNNRQTVDLWADPTTHRLLTDVSMGGLGIPAYDYVAYTNTNTTTDTYVFKTGGSGGTTVATVTIVYTDTTKSQISTVTKT